VVSGSHLVEVFTFEVLDWCDLDWDLAWASHHEIELVVVGPSSVLRVVVDTTSITLHIAFHPVSTLAHPLHADTIDDLSLLAGNFLELSSNTHSKFTPFLSGGVHLVLLVLWRHGWSCSETTS